MLPDTIPSSSSPGADIIHQWLDSKGFKPFPFQEEAWWHICTGDSGMVNAPTGCGKTFSVFLGAVIQFINDHPEDWRQRRQNGLRLLWITPLRALAKDLGRAMEQASEELGLPWKIGIRNGDTDTAERCRQKKQMPEVLIITPESLHLLLAMKGHHTFFKTLRIIAVDEWHELMGGKRGVQVELAIAYLIHLHRLYTTGYETNSSTGLQIWGISATIGNLEEAMEVLMRPLNTGGTMVQARIPKHTEVRSIIPEEIEKYPWAGHLGMKLMDKVVSVIERHKTTLVFINTRGMAERWYQGLLDYAPQLAGAIALHHGSIEQELRLWVEEALHEEKLKAVVTTSSLDLGVDFRPVDAVIQVGSPKGVARFLQRAGRSGHQPGAASVIYFVPTHSLELVEAAALTRAMKGGEMESRIPQSLCFDVLCQFLCTLAVGDGFRQETMLPVVASTFCFQEMREDEWWQVLSHITEGGQALRQYDEYRKVEVEEGVYKINSRRIALRHRLSIGTIVSDAMLKVKFLTGGYLGHIEEWFISRLEPGDVFTLAGRNVELVQIKDMTVMVRKSRQKKSIVPSWMGGRMSLTANLGRVLRETIGLAAAFNTRQKAMEVQLKNEGDARQIIDPLCETDRAYPEELQALTPLFQLQMQLSVLPRQHELLIEHHVSREGYHVMVFPFEGRQVHEAMSAILAYRISRMVPITFSLAMNDYGFELLSDSPIPLTEENVHTLFDTEDLLSAMQQSVNHVEMAMRKFRDISVIGGLVFQGMPGEQKKARHLQASSSLVFKVFRDFDPGNLLLQQAHREVLEQEMEEARLREALKRIREHDIRITYPRQFTPLAFPLVADGLNRNNLSSENLEARIRKMAAALNGF